MMHGQIWAAIDALARRRGLTPSGLARAAGLDPTAFNKSKRNGPDGKPRWPSTESLARVFAATGATMEEFSALVAGREADLGRAIAIVGMAHGGLAFSAEGFPIGATQTQRFPGFSADDVYALEISGDAMTPALREGDVVIVQPGAAVRRGDRVAVRTRDGELIARTLGRRTEEMVELLSVNPSYPTRTLRTDQIEWLARIVWASQ